MKYIKQLLLLILVVTLTGCKTTPFPEKLASAENLSFGEHLTWDKVENATGYDVYINDLPVHSDNNYYVISEEGEYEVYVVAKAPGFEDSDASMTLDLSLIYENEIDPVYSVEGNKVSWDSIDDALSYNVIVNGVQSSTTNTFVFVVPPGILDISIQAVYPVGTSNVSASEYFVFELETKEQIEIQYSSQSDVDIILFNEEFLGEVYIEDNQGNILSSAEVLVYSNDYRAISSSFVKSQTGSVVEFHLLVGSNRYPVTITLSDKETPYIISSTIIHTEATEDVNLQYELFDGSIYSINGTAEDTVLYSVDGSILTIEKEFIAGKFLLVNEFTLSYVINVGEDSVIGYLHFKKPIVE